MSLTILKSNETEMKAREIFGGDFISLADACAVFKKSLLENDTKCFHSTVMDQTGLIRAAKEGYCLLTFPKITIKEICSAVPGLFVFDFARKEIDVLERRELEPGRYLVKKCPRRLSFDGCQMRENGYVNKEYTTLEQTLFICALNHLMYKEIKLTDKLILVCKHEVKRRGVSSPVYVKLRENKLRKSIDIKVWQKEGLLRTVLPIKKVV